MDQQLQAWNYKELSKEINTLLRRYTEGDANVVVESAGGEGLEAYRALNKSSENHATGKASQMREECTKLGHSRAKDSKELAKQYAKFNVNLTKYRKAAGTELDEQTRCDTLMKMVPMKMREHLI